MTNSTVVSINVKSNGQALKKYVFEEESGIEVLEYEAVRISGNLFAVKYTDANVLSFEIIEADGSSIDLARLELNAETEQLLAKLNDVTALELLALLAKYPQDEL